MGGLVFVTGGARSGKSRFAEQIAGATGSAPVIYLATMEPGDEELKERIAVHRGRRPPSWTTVEEPLALEGALHAADPRATVLLDCLSLWVSNVFMRQTATLTDDSMSAFAQAVSACLAGADALVKIQAGRSGMLIAVSNEVGWGIVPEGRLSRYYRDALGMVNQRLAAAADEGWLLVSGIPVRLTRSRTLSNPTTYTSVWLPVVHPRPEDEDDSRPAR